MISAYKSALVSHIAFILPRLLLCSPNRDFITVEGFQGYVGRKFRVSAWRGDLLIGGAEGTGVAGDVLGEVSAQCFISCPYLIYLSTFSSSHFRWLIQATKLNSFATASRSAIYLINTSLFAASSLIYTSPSLG
jgi:hypothetical protein